MADTSSSGSTGGQNSGGSSGGGQSDQTGQENTTPDSPTDDPKPPFYGRPYHGNQQRENHEDPILGISSAIQDMNLSSVGHGPSFEPSNAGENPDSRFPNPQGDSIAADKTATSHDTLIGSTGVFGASTSSAYGDPPSAPAFYDPLEFADTSMSSFGDPSNSTFTDSSFDYYGNNDYSYGNNDYSYGNNDYSYGNNDYSFGGNDPDYGV